MITINENFLELKPNYLFSEIAKRTEDYKRNNPKADIIKLGIGDVTLPLTKVVTDAMQKAVQELTKKDNFRGYGPEIGYDFLRDKIAEFDYRKREIDIGKDEIFISDGIACDIGNFGDLLCRDNIVAIPNPVYPEYLDINIMKGVKKIVYIPFTAENNFTPELPKEDVDLIYLCLPNNPTGTVLKKDELKEWIDYAIEHKALILFDAAYEAFIEEKDIPHSVYEIEGAKKVAIEFKSYSKTAGFTGVRCAYTVVPKEAIAFTKTGKEISLNTLWKRRQCTKFNGVSYITQRGAEAIYTKEGQEQIRVNLKYYKTNAEILREGLKNIDYKVYGGVNSPYIWLKIPEIETSWSFFDKLLNEANIVTTPGAGFGKYGEGFIRLSSFGSIEDSKEAIKRITERCKR